MMDPISLVRDGGPIAMLLVLVGPASLLATLVCGFARVMGLRVPTVAWLAAPVLTVLVGYWGSWIGLGQALAVGSAVSVEMKSTLMAAGLAYGLYTTVLALGMAVPILLIAANTRALIATGRPGDEPTFTPMHAIAPAVLAILGGVGIAVVMKGVFPAVTVALGCLAIAVASVRVGEGDMEQAGADRAGVGVLAITAAIALAELSHVARLTMFHHAMARASAETKQAILATLAQASQLDPTAALVAAAVIALAALTATGPLALTFGRRSVLGGTATAVLLVVWGGASLVTHTRIDQMVELARPFDLVRADFVERVGIVVPRSGALAGVREQSTVSISPAGIWLDGEPTDALDHETLTDRVNLEAHESLAIGQIRDVLMILRFKQGTSLVVRRDSGTLGTIHVDVTDTWAPRQGDWEDPPLNLRIDAQPGRYVLSAGHTGFVLYEAQQVRETLARLKDKYPDEDTIVIVPTPDLEMAEIVSLLDAARYDPAVMEDGRGRTLFPRAVMLLP